VHEAGGATQGTNGTPSTIPGLIATLHPCSLVSNQAAGNAQDLHRTIAFPQWWNWQPECARPRWMCQPGQSGSDPPPWTDWIRPRKLQIGRMISNDGWIGANLKTIKRHRRLLPARGSQLVKRR
jgi:hypothetical protein